MRQKDNTKSSKTLLVAFLAALALVGCGDKKGGPPDDEGGEIAVTEKASSKCDTGTFADCAREVLVSSGLLEAEKEDLMGCKFETAKPQGTPADQFEAARQAVKRTCE